MIAYLKGKLAYKDPTFVIIDVNGIGYHVKVSLTTFGAVKEAENCQLFTYLHVKEDAHTLYGFFKEEEKKLFLMFISISGVGPSTALTMLSSLSSDELKYAIAHEDVKTVQGIKGIGAKTAQRIILELKDKILKEGISDKISPLGRNSHNTLKTEALSALITLGINKTVAEKTLDKTLKNASENITLEELIKLALKST